MPHSNFSRKNRKSRSRGSSVRRARNKSNQANRSKADRAASLDLAPGSSDAAGHSVEKDNSLKQANKELSVKVPPVESDAGSSSHTKEIKKDTFKSKNCETKSKKEISKMSPSTKLKPEEDKLDNLCSVIERLKTTYGLQNGPLPSSSKSESSNIVFPSKFDEAAFPETTNKTQPLTNADSEVSLSQAEKQAMRKAKKDVKKSGKPSIADSPSPSAAESSVTQINGECTPDSGQGKSKADLKRERREKQEAQRAAKEAAAKTKPVAVPGKQEERQTVASNSIVTTEEKVVKKIVKKKEDRHLPLLEHLSARVGYPNKSINNSSIHPAIRSVGICMQHLTIDGCVSRVLATLSAICSLIEDYKTPEDCDLSRDLTRVLSPNVAFLNACRPIPEPMNNAIRFVRREINEISSSMSEKEGKEAILNAIDVYIHQNIVLASQAIIQNALEFVEDRDVILTFGFSTLVFETMKAAILSKERLSVVLVDNPGSPSGLNLLQKYVNLGIDVHYRTLPDLQHIINKVTKVIIEAEAVVLNGAVIGHCGMAGLILLASSNAVPVIAISHTFKFCNIDLTDSLVMNELRDSSSSASRDDLVPNSEYLANWKDVPSLNVVNLIYDVTPPSLINVLVTERNNFPTSVVPVIIKRNYADILGQD